MRFTRGADRLVTYKVPDAERFTQVFCVTCGALIPRLDRDRGLAIVPMGAFDDDPLMHPQAHTFTASKAPWYDITDGLPQHAENPS